MPNLNAVYRQNYENCYAMTFGGDIGLYVFPLLCYYATLTAAATKAKPIGDYDDCRFTIIVNSASMVPPIGLPPKMAEFCHTSNRLLLGRRHCSALLRLYFNSSAVSRWLLVVGRWCWSTIRVPGLWEVSLQKYKILY
jgi:hypothetical protein